MNMDRNLLGRMAKFLELAVLAGALFGYSYTVRAAAPIPLSPLDTSSPQATLQGFIATVDDIYKCRIS